MDTHHDEEHHEDHGGLGQYLVVFLCLCALTACSFMTVAPWWPFAKTPTIIFMMGVSTVKAMLVIMFFMHLLWEANWKYVLTIPAAMMSVFLLLMLIPDVGCRRNWYSEERMVYAAEAAEVHADGEHENGEDGAHAGHDTHAAPSDGEHSHANGEDHSTPAEPSH